jgi:outer membrane lipase/esterase
MSKFEKWFKVTVVAAALCAGATVEAAPTNVYVFGDSLMDTGNLFLAIGTPPAPYFNGRFSNGPLFDELIAGKYGITLTPSLTGGNNFSWAGAQTGTGLSSGFIPNVQTQINAFLGVKGGVADPNALYIIDGGGNDVLPAANSGNVPAAIAGIVQNIVTEIETLAGHGAKNFEIVNVADVGATPRVRAFGPAAAAGATAISAAIDQGLLQALMAIHGSDPSLDLDLLDLFGIGASVAANPAAYGFTNTIDPCFDGTSVCANPDQYLYWDTFHPTAAVGRIVASTSTTQIPEPPTLLMLGLALAGLMFSKRKTA